MLTPAELIPFAVTDPLIVTSALWLSLLVPVPVVTIPSASLPSVVMLPVLDWVTPIVVSLRDDLAIHFDVHIAAGECDINSIIAAGGKDTGVVVHYDCE